MFRQQMRVQKKDNSVKNGVYFSMSYSILVRPILKRHHFQFMNVAGSKELRGYANHWGVMWIMRSADAIALAAVGKMNKIQADTNCLQTFYKNYGKLQKLYQLISLS